MTEVVVTIVGIILSGLITALGIIVSKQMDKLSDKAEKYDGHVLDVRSKVVELKSEIETIKSYTRDSEKKMSLIQNLMSEIKKDKTSLSPLVENLVHINKKLDDQDVRIKTNADNLGKVFDIVKKVVAVKK